MSRILWLSHGSIRESETFLSSTIETLASLGQVFAVHGGRSQNAEDARLGVRAADFMRPRFRWGPWVATHAFRRGDWLVGVQHRCAHRVARLLGDFRPDIVWVDYATSAVFGRSLLDSLGVPYIVHVHGYDITSSMASLHYRRHFQEAVAGGAAAVLCASHHMARLCVLAGVPDSKVRVLRLAVDSSRIFRDPAFAKTREPSLIHLGRLVPQKGPLITLEAFKRVARRHPTATITFIGDGPLRPELERRIARNGLHDRVRLLGAMEHAAALREMQCHWVFCQHSVIGEDGGQEGFAISPAEAACMELAVVSTWHDGIPEHVIDCQTGFLVREYDYERMADRMCELIEDAELRVRMGIAGRRNIAELCDPSRRQADIRHLIGALVPG